MLRDAARRGVWAGGELGGAVAQWAGGLRRDGSARKRCRPLSAEALARARIARMRGDLDGRSQIVRSRRANAKQATVKQADKLASLKGTFRVQGMEGIKPMQSVSL